MNRTKPVRRFKPTVEHLEDRTTPAGNVTAGIFGGNLFVVGDDATNRIVIAQWGDETIAIAPLDFTTINGIGGPTILRGFDGGAYIWMGGGDDILSLIALTPEAGLSVDMGTGDDTLWMTAVSPDGVTFVTGGGGGDIINLIASGFGGGFISTSFEGVPSTPIVTAKNDTGTVAEGGNVDIDLAANDKVSRGSLDLTSIEVTDDPANGTVTVNDDGTVTYTHSGSETTSDSFTYTITDKLGNVSNEATVNITVTPVNDAPTAVNDTGTVAEGGTVTINVAANDTDPDSQINLGSIVITQNPANGTVEVKTDGTVIYTHKGTETTSDTFRYTIKDAQGATSGEATVTINVTPVNDAPTATDDTATVAEGGTVSIPVSTNDNDPEGKLDLTSIVITQDPTNGTVTVKTDGTVTYTHKGTETTSDTFRYTIKDTEGTTSTPATVTITVTPVNDPPVANNDTATVDEGSTVTINLADDDTDPDSTIDLTSIVITQDPTDGTVTVNTDGTVLYTHKGTETTSDTFTYTIKDLQGATSNEATVTITVTPVNDPPVANPDTGTVAPETSTSINVAGNDTDVDGTLKLDSIVITKAAAHGTTTVNLNGTVTYQHDGTVATSDTFSYTIKDDLDAVSNETTVDITIT